LSKGRHPRTRIFSTEDKETEFLGSEMLFRQHDVQNDLYVMILAKKPGFYALKQNYKGKGKWWRMDFGW
jgi:hypothetical protein